MTYPEAVYEGDPCQVYQQYVRPTLRDDLGAYAAGAGVDLALDELFLFVYRCPALAECCQALATARLAGAISHVSDQAFERAHRTALSTLTFEGDDSELNRAVSSMYDVITDHKEKIGCLRSELTTLDLKRATRLTMEFFENSRPVVTAATSDAAIAHVLQQAHGFQPEATKGKDSHV